MPPIADMDVDQIDFVYSPDQPLSVEQRIELLESQVAEMQEQIAALTEQLNWLPETTGSQS